MDIVCIVSYTIYIIYTHDVCIVRIETFVTRSRVSYIVADRNARWVSHIFTSREKPLKVRRSTAQLSVILMQFGAPESYQLSMVVDSYFYVLVIPYFSGVVIL